MHEATRGGDAWREAASREAGEPALTAREAAPQEQDAEGVIFVDNHSGVSHELTASPLGHDVSANLFLNILLNVNHDIRKFMIIKLVSHSDIQGQLRKYCQQHQSFPKQPTTRVRSTGKNVHLHMQLISVLFGIILVGKRKVYLAIVIPTFARMENAWHYQELRKKYSRLLLVLAR